MTSGVESMKERLVLFIVLGILVYMLIPWVLTRLFGIGVIRRGLTKKQIALTFDDGPDPQYTPQLLDLLVKYQIKATFFVLGSKAEKYPELIRRIHEEGHQIGIHNYTHSSNWLMTPWNVRHRQVTRSADIVNAIIGQRPIYYRPPWGIINLFDFLLLRQYKIVLWSTMGRDWSSRIGKKKLKSILMNKTKDGSIVLLHDSGDTFGADQDAPSYMLPALEEAVIELRKRELQFVRVDEMGMEPQEATLQLSTNKRLLVSVWMLWEKLFVKLFRVTPIDISNPLLKLRVREYLGNETLKLEDGEQFHKGDRIAELHFDNQLLFNLGVDSRSSVHLAIQIIRRTELLMPQILKLLETDPNYQDVKGLYGISLIHRGSKQLGFTVLDLPQGIFSRVTRYYLRFLIYIIHPQGKDRLKTKPELLVPKIIAISKKELMNRYIA
jgi:peptidoglycan/xylan/chitin deacetylase (PgdA/CDA1 family)